MLLVLCGIFIFTFTIYEIFQISKRQFQLIPGPFGLPILGHLPFLGSNPTKKLQEWKKRYGPIFLIRFGSFPTVILNDVKIIREAFNRPEFSGRPKMKIFLVRGPNTKGEGIVTGDGVETEEQRQFCTKSVKEQRTSIISSTAEGITDFVNQLAHTEGQNIDIRQPINSTLTKSFWSVLLGHDSHKQGLQTDLLMECLDNMGKSDNIISALGLFIPWLDKILNFVGHFGSDVTVNRSRTLFACIQSEIQKTVSSSPRISNQPTSIVDAYLDKVEATTDPRSSFHKDQNYLPYFSMDMYIAATETVRTALEWLVYHMTNFPLIQTRIQKEVDAVVGSSRIPTWDDRPLLPYVEAVIYEVLRFSPSAPLGIFHRAMEDSQLRNYKIPKDTLLISNLYAVHHDKEIWGDPQNFRPERWLETNSNLNQREKSPLLNYLVPFGMGRRMCLGQDIAMNEMFLFTSILFQKYNVYPAKDNPPVRPVFGFVTSPSKFQVVFRKRANVQ